MSYLSHVLSLARAALSAADPSAKLAAIVQLRIALATRGKPQAESAVPPASTPGLDDTGAVAHLARGTYQKWQLVEPAALKRRNPASPEGRAALLHSIAHIEYSAIDLALDHTLRFAGMPADYYIDWLQVACEEAEHFSLLRSHLQTLAHDYGDFPVHDGLWQMAEKTSSDVLARMAMVPRLLEARGLDATPPIQQKLAAVGDLKAVRILDVILHDEEGHVALGDRWFRHLCAQRELPPEASFRHLIQAYAGPWPQSPMNIASRLRAGFGQQELDDLTACRPAR